MKLTAYDAQQRRKYLIAAENGRFKRAAKKLPKDLASFCLTIYYSGCRLSEALNLVEDDIEFDTRIIRLRCLKKRGKLCTRRVPVPEELVQMLSKLAAKSENERIWKFSRTTGWRIIKGVMKEANITGIHATTKGLRHGFGVRGGMEKIPVNVLRDWMGHSDIETTAIYLDLQDEEARQLMSRIW